MDKYSLHPSCCPYGGIVNTLCFWGAMREATWKRPLLLVCSIGLQVVFVTLFWIHRHDKGIAVLSIGTGFFIAVGLLGIMVAINGCDACVARMAGSI
jgi:hypothetical protein